MDQPRRPNPAQPDQAPTFRWKGLSLDIARSFFPLPEIERLVDRMAGVGLNILHLHLSDDQGWRLEIPGRPELTEVSGASAIEGGRGGYLTTSDWAELVAYADQRGITVVPEIDLPGHSNAALHACPELNPSGRAAPAYHGAEVGFSSFSADLPATEVFLRDVFGAIAAMTPGPWIHIGGDEARSTSQADYITLVRLAAKIVMDLGKRPVAWQEAAVAELGADLILEYWMFAGQPAADPAPAGVEPDPVALVARATQAATLRQAERGAQVILAPAQYAYFDMKHSPADTLGQDWAGYIDVERAGDWDPSSLLPGLDPAAILGVEAAIWTEFIHSQADLDYMLWPRLERFARVAKGFTD